MIKATIDILHNKNINNFISLMPQFVVTTQNDSKYDKK